MLCLPRCVFCLNKQKSSPLLLVDVQRWQAGVAVAEVTPDTLTVREHIEDVGESSGLASWFVADDSQSETKSPRLLECGEFFVGAENLN